MTLASALRTTKPGGPSMRVVVTTLLVVVLTGRLAAETPCPTAPFLPAYAHNDYENGVPLFDALRMGYRGVEVDLFLVDGELRVAHDHKRARSGRTLESLYLEPLRATVARCGAGAISPGPFLLNIEIKEESPATYDTLCAALRRYSDLLTVVDHGVERAGPIQVILVGWHPSLEVLEAEPLRLVHVQQMIVARSAPVDSSAVVRLVSLNYGKTIRWSGERPLPPAARGWLDALQRAKSAGPGRIVRVYNVPARAAIYRALLAAGVDLIGSENLDGTLGALSRARSDSTAAR